MSGRTGKMGRGGGGGGSAGKRPPVNRAVSTGRLPKVGGPRGRVGASSDSIISPPTTSFQVEESFSLVRENPLNFGMAIKLAPDLVDEIKRVEAHGGSACIKFDAHANNPGNVIRVGDKIYRFTWSKEPGDLCDIYEETQNGGDGNGLLVESGGTWRKLNVERELDESTKNLVKKRSEEAEQKLKSRKAIVLDPQNPSMKNQMKAIAASESNPWRNFKNRKEYPSKKRKFEPPAVTAAGLPSSVPKSGSSATHISRGNLSSSSPLLSHQERHCPQTSPAGSGHHLKGYVGAPEVLSQSMDKTLDPDRETLPKLQNGNAAEKVKQTGNMETKPSDIRGPMISLLLEHNDRGMLFKDLERTIGDAFPNSARQILPTLKQIAICQASGRYFLKPGLEMESLNKLPSQSQSSPAMNHHEAPEQQGLSKLSSTEAVTKTQEKVALGVIPVLTAEDVEKIDILSNSPQHSHEKKILNNDDGVASSSDTAGSGTDSDSDISETDSDSGSNSRSKSGSQCSTDAQSDASDEEVDILTRDDDKEPLHKLCDSGAPSFKSPVDIGDNGRNDAFVHGMIGIGNDLPQVGDNAEVRPTHLFRNEEGEEHVEQMQSSADHHGQDRGQIRGKIVDKAREPGAHDRSLIGGSKRHFDDAHCDVKARNGKRFKSENSSHPVSGTLNSIFGDSPVQSPDRGIANPIVNGTSLQNGTNGRIVQPDYNEVIPNSLVSDTQQVNRRSSEAVKLTDGRKKAFKNELHGQASKYSENIQFRGGSGDKKFDGKGRVLQRELSDLELGELRETETPEDKSPFKHPEEKPYDKFDEAEKLSPGNQEAVNSAIADPLSKRKATEHNANHMKPLHRDPQPQHQSFGKHVEVPEINGKARASEVGANTKSHGDTGRKLSTDTVGRNSSIPPISGTQVAKENRKQGHDIALSNGKRKRASITTGINEGGGERKNSLDEVVCSYIKYEKLEPELKGPIKDTSRYQNYVKEYQEKYESYSSLHKILELYSNKFSKLDKELVDCKGQDKKKCAADILKQVVSLYNECGENFKRLKKIFLVLHVELQHLKKMMKDFAASYQNT